MGARTIIRYFPSALVVQRRFRSLCNSNVGRRITPSANPPYARRPFRNSELAARPPHPDLLPACGEKEKGFHPAAAFASPGGGANSASSGRLIAAWRVGATICAPVRSVT
jgi:hypothetical protein